MKEIPEEAVDKSGSVRMVGVTAEEFIQPGPGGTPSKHSLFQARIAQIANVSIDNVDVFTVLHSPHNSNSSLLDVRFSAHGSPYRQPEKLNADIARNKGIVSIAIFFKVLVILCTCLMVSLDVSPLIFLLM